MEKKIVIYLIAIVIILAVVFLGQQTYFRNMGKTLISAATNKVGAYLAKGSNWVTSSIYPKISGEVENRGEIMQAEVNQTKQKVTEDIPKQIENYFSGIANAIAGKNNNTCPPEPAQTSKP